MKTRRTNWLHPRKPKVKMCDHNGTKSMSDYHFLGCLWVMRNISRWKANPNLPYETTSCSLVVQVEIAMKSSHIISVIVFGLKPLWTQEVQKELGSITHDEKLKGKFLLSGGDSSLLKYIYIYLPICNLVTICLWLTAIPHLDYSRHRQGVTHFLPSGPCRDLLST